MIQKKILGLGTTTLIISNKEIEDTTKIVNFFEESGLLIKAVCEAKKIKAKEQKGGFLSILLGKLDVSWFSSLLGNLLIGKDVIRTGKGKNTASQDF